MGIRDWFRGGKREDRDDGQVRIELTPSNELSAFPHLFIDIPEIDILRAIDGWNWLPLAGLTVVAVSAFGEVFLRDNVGAIFQIDTIEGNLSHVADSVSGMTAMLQTVEARDSLLFEGLVLGARDRGLILDPGECYDFKIAPILGGQMGLDELEKQSLVVKLHLAGQMHEQVRDLPPGTRINNISIST